MEDNSSRNVLAISATVIALGALAYLMTEKEAMVEKFVPLPSVVAYEEPKVADLPALTDEFVSQVSADNGIDLGEETVLSEIEAYEVTSVDELPPLTLGESDLPEMAGIESPSVDDLPPLES
jgi:hypothetical protein